MRNIFDIGAEGRALETLLEDSEGEVDEQLEHWFDDLGDEREAKLESYCYVIAEFEARAEARRRKVKALEEHARADENNVKRLKDRLLKAFEVFGWKKEKAGSLTVSRVKNGGKVPIIWELPTDLNLLPEEFLKREPTLNNDAIATALETTPDLGFAKLGERGFHVKIA